MYIPLINFNDSLFAGSAQRSWIIPIIIATLLVVAVVMTILGYSYSFWRRTRQTSPQPFEAAVINKKIMAAIMATLGLNVILIIFTWLYTAGIINQNPTKAGGIGLIIASYLPVLAVIIYILFFLQYLAIGIDQREISFIGERILLRNVEGLDQIEPEKLIVLRYRYGFRNPKSKKMKFKVNSQTGQLLLINKQLVTAEINLEEDKAAASAAAPATARPDEIKQEISDIVGDDATNAPSELKASKIKAEKSKSSSSSTKS